MVLGLQTANLLLRLLVELAALAALAGWAWQLPAGAVTRWTAAVGIPLTAATLWAVFASPEAPVQAEAAVGVGVQFLVLGGAGVALAASGRPRLAGAFAIVALINAALMALWHQ